MSSQRRITTRQWLCVNPITGVIVPSIAMPIATGMTRAEITAITIAVTTTAVAGMIESR